MFKNESSKGKQATKGKKQIYEDNQSTIKNYSLMTAALFSFTLAINLLFFNDKFTLKYWFIHLFLGAIQIAGISFMKFMAKPQFSETGQLLDSGMDLSANGTAEHVLDIIICTLATQFFSLFSNWLLLLWLAVPGRAFYLLWVNVIAPWVFQPAMPEEELNEKKQKKLERKQIRRQQLR